MLFTSSRAACSFAAAMALASTKTLLLYDEHCCLCFTLGMKVVDEMVLIDPS